MNKKDYNKEYYQKNKERLKEVSKNWYYNHKTEHRENQRKRYQRVKKGEAERKRTPRVKQQIKERSLRIKLEVLSHYSHSSTPKCTQCGEIRLPCLTIDHVNNNGNEHRRVLRLTGTNFYSWLKKQKYPEEYQTLCMNCQFCKASENA